MCGCGGEGGALSGEKVSEKLREGWARMLMGS